MKLKKILCVLLTLTLVLTLAPVSALAGDYESHWSAQYIDEAIERGWMQGDGEGDFRPGDTITRGEFAMMLWLALGSPAPVGGCPFTDVPEDAYYRDAVAWLFEQGMVNGYGDGRFGPGDTLTREMGFTMLARAFELAPDPESGALSGFLDAEELSGWARDAAAALVESGYVEGDGGSLMPRKALTRGEMAKLLIVVYDGETAPEPDMTPPVITLTQTPETATYGSVKISAEAESASGIAFIGWRTSQEGAVYTDTGGFADITETGTFSAYSNGWYAVCAVDTLGNFAFELIRVTNILIYYPPAPPSTYTVTYDANGGTGTTYVVTRVSGSPASGFAETGFAAPTNKSFYGWNTAADDSGTFYKAGKSVPLTADTTLYAVYTGDGSDEAYPTEIRTADDLQAMNDDLTNHYKLVGDITLTTWTPIGEYSDDNSSSFTGSFDGNGHTVTFGSSGNPVVLDKQYAGLFGYISGGVVKNVTVAGGIKNDFSVSNSYAYLGGIAGFNGSGTIENCTVTASIEVSVNNPKRVGGVVGYNTSYATVQNCYATGTVTASGGTNNIAGGVVGWNNTNGGPATVQNCYTTGTVTASGGSNINYAGGVVGYNNATAFTAKVQNCYATGDVTASGGTNNYAGGIVGYSDTYVSGATVQNCYATGTVTASGGTNNYAGGIVGENNVASSTAKVLYCAALGTSVSASGTGTNAAGRVVGLNNATLTDNYADSTMTVTVGGVTKSPLVDGADKEDGADVAGTDYNTDTWWKTTLGWSALFGNSDAAPWVWDGTKNLPKLYWQSQ